MVTSFPPNNERRAREDRTHYRDPSAEPLLSQVAEAKAVMEALHASEEALRLQGAHVAEAQSALEREQRRHQELFDFLPDAGFVTDAKGVVQEANHAVSSLIGYARGYLRGKPLAALVHPEDGALFAAQLDRLRKAASDRVQAFALRLRARRTGAPVQTRVRVAPLRDGTGTLAGLRWLLRDVTAEAATTERLRTLEAAHAAELRTRTMELEAVVRMQAAQLTDTERTQTELRRIAAEARQSLQHGAEPRALLAHVLDALARAGVGPVA